MRKLLSALSTPNTWVAITSVMAVAGLACLVAYRAAGVPLLARIGFWLVVPHVVASLLVALALPFLAYGMRRGPLASADTGLALLLSTRGAKVAESGSARLPFAFPDDAVGRAVSLAIAERCFGDPAARVALTLHVSGNGASATAELEASPSPTKAPIPLVVRFRTGEQREFQVLVPSSPQPGTRSAPCAPFAPEGAKAEAARWVLPEWPPTIKLA